MADMQQIFFTNLQLLGFDCDAMERRLRIPFKPDMFNLPNKKGFEIVMQFLFSKLDPVKCRELMRDCWPVDSKAREQAFRRAVNNWLAAIEKEDPDSHLPRITASLFMSPGGDRFYQLLLCFSRYVMYKLSVKANGKKRQNFLRFPVLTPNASHLGETVATAIKCGTVRERGKFMEHTQVVTAMQDEWRRYAAELVKTNRALTKEIRSLDKQIREEQQKSSEGGLARGSPMRLKKGAWMGEYDYNIQKVKRAQKVQKVRDQWKAVDEFYVGQREEREIVASILEGTMDKYKIDASELNVKVPDLLLRECEQEIQRRNVDNIYQGGKVNLVSLVHLWNLSLHLYIEKLHQAGLPRVDEVIPEVKTQIHAHHAEFVNAQALSTKLESYLLPELRSNIKSLQRRLDEKMGTMGMSPHSMAARGTGLSFLPPTPPLIIQPTSATKTPGELNEAPSKVPSPYKEDTPEAASRLIESITNSVRSEHASLHQGSPLFSRGDGMRGLLPEQTSRLPQRAGGVTGRTRVHSAPQGLGSRSAAVLDTETGAETRPVSQLHGAKLTMTAQVTRHVSKTADDQNVFKVPTSAVRPKKRQHKSVHPKVERHQDVVASVTQSTSGGSELNTSSPRSRADDRSPGSRGVVLTTTGGQEYGLHASSPLGQDPEAILGEQAFMSRQRVSRTPQTKPAWPEEDEGPLSSTRIEPSTREPIDRQQVQRVALQLFSPEVSDTEDHIVTVSSPQRPLARDSPLRARMSKPSPQQTARLERLESEMLRSCSPISQKQKARSGDDDDLEMPSSISDINSPRSVRSDFSQHSVRSDRSPGDIPGVRPLSDSLGSHGEPAPLLDPPHGGLPPSGLPPSGLPHRASGDGMPAAEAARDSMNGRQSFVHFDQVAVETGGRDPPTDDLLGLDMGDADDIVNSIMNGTPEDPLGLAREFDQEFNSTHPEGAIELLPATETYHELKQTATPQLPKRSRPVSSAVGGDGEEDQSGLGYGVAEYDNVPQRFTRTTVNNNPRLSTDEKMFLLDSMSQDVSKVNSVLQESLRARDQPKQPPLVERDELEDLVFSDNTQRVSATDQPLIDLKTVDGSSHQPGSSSHQPGSSSHQPGSSSHQPGSSSHQPGSSSHQPGSSSHQPGSSSHRHGSSSHQPVGSSHQPDSFSHRQGSYSHQPGGSSHQYGSSSHQHGRASHQTGSSSLHSKSRADGVTFESSRPMSGRSDSSSHHSSAANRHSSVNSQPVNGHIGDSSHHSNAGSWGEGPQRTPPMESPAAPVISQSETENGTTDQEEENVHAISFRDGQFTEIVEKSPAKRGAYFTESRKDHLSGGRSPLGSLHSSLNKSHNSSSSSTVSHQLLDELYERNLLAQGVRDEDYHDDRPGYHDDGSRRHDSSPSNRSRGSGEDSPSDRSGKASPRDGGAPVGDFLSTDVGALIARYRQLRVQMAESSDTGRLPPAGAGWEPSDSLMTDTTLVSLSNSQANGHVQTHINRQSNGYGMDTQNQDPFSPKTVKVKSNTPIAMSTRRRGSLQDFITSPGGSEGVSPLEGEEFPGSPSPGSPLSPGGSPVHPALLASLPMSPHTDKLHTSDVQFKSRRLTDQWDNILSQGDSLLVPSSPED